MQADTLPGLTTHTLGKHLVLLDEVDSTNSYLMRQGQNSPEGLAVIAKYQTAGKGRLGRNWHNEPGQTLCLSVLLEGYKPEDMSLLPLMVGLAVREAVFTLCGVSPAIKWPNDVLLSGKKICGILCESRISQTNSYVVCGAGVNLTQQRAVFDEQDLSHATSLLLETGKTVTPEQMASAILNALEQLLDTYREEGFAPLKAAYQTHCANVGRDITFVKDGETHTGTATGIDTDGALICEVEGKQIHLRAGEVSLHGFY